jgi:adenine deaminase
MKISNIIPVALGKKKADVLIKNAKILNVFSGEIEETNVALYKKRIAGIGDYTEAEKVIDLKGMYLVPGFIDAHLHIESSMLSPREFAKAVLSRGTTTVIADPHEIANVLGIDGIEYIIKATEGIPLNVYIGLPSAVPATNLETSGALLGPEDMVGLLDKYPRRIIALGEVMNFPGVLNVDRELITKIEILRHKYKKIDGHAPGLTGKELNAYIDAFIKSDHECTTIKEALEKISKGMQVFIREGSAAKNFDDLIGAVNIKNHQFFSFCTDDRDPVDIVNEGHIDYLVRKSIKLGIDPIIAVRMATINTAKYFNLRSMGAIAPGYKADMIVVDDLQSLNIKMVIKDSKIAVENGSVVESFEGVHAVPTNLGKVILPKFNKNDIKVKAKKKKINVIEIFEKTLMTKHIVLDAKIENELVVADPENDISKIVVFNRHTGSGYSIGFIKGLGLKKGAVALSIGHDSHNLCAAGISDSDIEVAAKEIERMNGGIVTVLSGEILARLPLPIAGLMSNKSLYEMVEENKRLKKSLETLGSEKDIFMTLSFVQLPVIPEIRITDKGIVNVKKQKFIDIFG